MELIMTTMQSYGASPATSGLTSTSITQTPQTNEKQKPLDRQTEMQMVSWVNEQYKLMKEARSKIELEWYLNMAFYFGKQWVQPSTSAALNNATQSARLISTPVPPWITRMIVNRVRPVIRTEHSKLTAQKPTVTVVPSSSEDKDYFAAQAGEQFWDSLYRSKKLKSVISRAAWWTCIAGTGFIKSWWDPEEIDRLNNVKGDICFSPVTPFHILVPDLKEEDLECQPYLMHIQTRDIDWIKLKYPDLQKVQPDTDGVTDILEDSFLTVRSNNSNQKQRNVLVKECWIKPGCIPQLPDGGLVTVIADQVVQFWPGWPYEHYNYPFAKIDHIRTGRFYGQSTIVDLIPLQKELNRTRSQIIDAKNTLAKPKLLAYRGSIDPNKITSQPGQVILVVPGFDLPQPLPLPPLPAYVTEEIERIVVDINDVSGQHEVSKGSAPPGVTAATAISYLQEQDESMLAQTYDSVEDAIEKIALMSLSYVHQYWTLPRKVKVTGIDGSFDSMVFSGATLGDNTDIRVEAGSSLPTSKAAKQAFIMDLMKMGFIPPQQGLEVMDMGGLNKITEQIQIDAKQAQRENLKMAAITPEQLQQYEQLSMQQAQVDPTTGMPQNPDNQMVMPDPATGMPQPQVLNPPPVVPVNTWDNHAVHIQKHNNYRKGQAFEQLDDAVKQLFEAHVKDHQDALMMTMPMQPSDSSGGPPNGGPPQPPSGSLDNQPQLPQLEGGMTNGTSYGQP